MNKATRDLVQEALSQAMDSCDWEVADSILQASEESLIASYGVED